MDVKPAAENVGALYQWCPTTLDRPLDLGAEGTPPLDLGPLSVSKVEGRVAEGGVLDLGLNEIASPDTGG